MNLSSQVIRWLRSVGKRRGEGKARSHSVDDVESGERQSDRDDSGPSDEDDNRDSGSMARMGMMTPNPVMRMMIER